LLVILPVRCDDGYILVIWIDRKIYWKVNNNLYKVSIIYIFVRVMEFDANKFENWVRKSRDIVNKSLDTAQEYTKACKSITSLLKTFLSITEPLTKKNPQVARIHSSVSRILVVFDSFWDNVDTWINWSRTIIWWAEVIYKLFTKRK